MEENKNLKSTVEAILFASGDAIDVNVVSTSLEVKRKELLEVVNELKNDYASDNRGITILIMDNMVQMATSENYSDVVESILSPIRSEKLTKSAIEVLSIIAYRQPITRTELAEIRGTRSDYLIMSLLKKGLIEKNGFKDTLGKPSTYGTTKQFLRDFNLESLDQLPQLDIVEAEVDIMELTKTDIAPAAEIAESTESEPAEVEELFQTRKISSAQ